MTRKLPPTITGISMAVVPIARYLSDSGRVGKDLGRLVFMMSVVKLLDLIKSA